MTSPLTVCLEGTVVLWATSSLLAVLLGLLWCAGSLSSRRVLRTVSTVGIDASRGVPTSLLVTAAGVLAGRAPAPSWLPSVFPGTSDGFRLVAWVLVVALAVGSAGHLAVVFRTAYRSLGRGRIEQTRVLGLAVPLRMRIIACETAVVALPTTGTRLVHHLHNTAFAALFPVTELFGGVQDRVDSTYDMSWVAIGAAAYVVLSGAIWVGVRVLEAMLLHRPVPRLRLAPAELPT